MDTLDFLRLILPKAGYKILATPRPAPYKGFKHHIANSVSQLAELAEELNAEGQTVYHACASFAEEQVIVKKRDRKTGELVDKPAVRVASNAAYCRSFWVDLDVDADDPEKYGSQKEAAGDILRACQEISLPYPLLVSSGYGIHAYWPLDNDVSAENWLRVATRFKALLNDLNVKQDNTRTADLASVLRPAGMSNRKDPENIKRVRVVRPAQPIALVDFLKPVVAAIKSRGTTVKDLKSRSMFSDGGSLTVKRDYPPSSAHTVADKCQAIGHVRMMVGNVTEPFWRAAMGVVKHCEEGDELAHKWSEGHPSYDRYETQDKLDRWQAGPATCESFKGFGHCDGCPFAGKIKSPIQLGLHLPESDATATPVVPAKKAEEPVEASPERDEDGRYILPAMPENLKQKFAYRAGNLLMKMVDDEGVVSFATVCQEYVVPHTVIRARGDAKSGNKAIVKCWRYTLTGDREEITVPVSAIATGGKDLVTAFGEIGIVVEGGPMAIYMKGWLQDLKSRAQDSLSVERMGWAGDDFVLGLTRYTPSGPVKAAVSSSLQGYLQAFDKQGDLETWSSLIDRAYNRPGQEQYQFLVGCGFGAPLIKYTGDYRGVIVSAVSYKSGQGKTTAQRAAMSIYGDASKLETAYGRQTQNALYEKLGAYGNLPYMIDEVSNIDTKSLADMAYAISQGIQKDRLTKDGSMRAQREPWQTMVMTSGNRSLIQALAADGTQREPEMRRVFEFNFRVVSDLSKTEADRIFRELPKHYGVAGEPYLDFIVKNQALVASMVAKIGEMVDEALQLRREERFWGAAITSTIAGLQIAKKLGLVSFDIKAIMAWVREQLIELRQMVTANAGDEYDLLNRLSAELTFDLWVTQNMGVRGKSPALVRREPKRGVVAGRLIIDDDILFLRPEYVRDWCETKRADYRALRQLLIDNGCFLPGDSRTRDILTGIQDVTQLRARTWTLRASKVAELSPLMGEVEQESKSNVVTLRGGEVS